LIFLVVVAVAIIRVRDLFTASMLFAIYSLISAGLFVVLDAGDVALTEAAVGAGIAPSQKAKRHHWLAFGVVAITGAFLVYATLDLPQFGDATSPAQAHVGAQYIANTYNDMGIPNMVAAVLASYRSIDTLGEGFVILTAGLAVYALLSVPAKRGRRRRRRVAVENGDE
jgi:multicomponent Na+:H+ antiporter subunit B